MVNVYPSQLVTDQPQTFHGSKVFQAILTKIGDSLGTGNYTVSIVDDNNQQISDTVVDLGTGEIFTMFTQVGVSGFNSYATSGDSTSFAGSVGGGRMETLKFSTQDIGRIATNQSGAALMDGVDGSTGAVGNVMVAKNKARLMFTNQFGDVAKVEVTDGLITLEVPGYSVTSYDIPKTKKTTILSADVYTLRTVPVELVPAPGAGKYIDVLDVVVFNTNASVPYDSTSLGTIYASNTYVFSSNSLILSQVDPTIAGTFSNNNAQLSISVNQALNIKLTSPSDPTVGDGDLVVYVTYKIVTL